MTTSKIKEIVKCNERKGHNKWFFTCNMENDDKISIMRNDDKALKVGDEIEYEKGNADEYGISRITEPSTGGNKKSFTPKNYKADAVSFSISYAKDLVIAGKATDLEKEADKIYMRMLSKFNSLNV